MKICLIPRNPVLFPPFSLNGCSKAAAVHPAGEACSCPHSPVWRFCCCSGELGGIALPYTLENTNFNVLSVEMAHQFPHHGSLSVSSAHTEYSGVNEHLLHAELETTAQNTVCTASLFFQLFIFWSVTKGTDPEKDGSFAFWSWNSLPVFHIGT